MTVADPAGISAGVADVPTRRKKRRSRSFYAYIGKRVGHALLVIWAAYTLTFLLLYLLPSDPVSLMLNRNNGTSDGGDFSASAEQAAALNREFGFDRSPVQQYFVLLWRAVQGDFGISVQNGQPVTSVVAEAIPQTLQLGLAALLLSIVLGAAVAIIISQIEIPWLRQLVFSVPPLLASLPGFWIALLLLQVFAFKLGWFAPTGNKGFQSLVLPAVTLAIPTGAIFGQVFSTSLNKVLEQPYIDTAFAKGASKRRILFRHGIRNGIIPVATMVAMTVGDLLAGAVVAETIFNRAGIGKLTQSSVNAQDIPVVQALVLVFALSFVVVNLVVDLLYPWIDPEIRSEW